MEPHCQDTNNMEKKSITSLLIIQRQINTSSETLARRYLIPFHNKVKNPRRTGETKQTKKKKSTQTKPKKSHQQISRLAYLCCLPALGVWDRKAHNASLRSYPLGVTSMDSISKVFTSPLLDSTIKTGHHLILKTILPQGLINFLK